MTARLMNAIFYVAPYVNRMPWRDLGPGALCPAQHVIIGSNRLVSAAHLEANSLNSGGEIRAVFGLCIFHFFQR